MTFPWGKQPPPFKLLKFFIKQQQQTNPKHKTNKPHTTYCYESKPAKV